VDRSATRTPPLAVVIPCKDDSRVVRCVESVDEAAEIVVVANGSPKEFLAAIRLPLERLGARLEVLAEANLARALELGIRSAASPCVLLMDSDCVFEPGAVGAFRGALAAGAATREVFKGEIEFEAGTSRIGAVIARTRRQHTGRPLTAFKPPLAFSREIAASIGGYFFDERLPWKEDADFDRRVRRAGLHVVAVSGGRIRHAPLTLRADLRSTFRYGVGAALADALGIEVTTPSRSIADTFHRDGAATAAYLALANGVRRAGYLHTRLRLLLGMERLAVRRAPS
jgi:glycosyltransferase involved in cell wall biosynthesis